MSRINCPVCEGALTVGVENDVTPEEPPRRPRPGDVAVCSLCASVGVVYNFTGDMVVLTPVQVAKLPPDILVVVEKTVKGLKQ